MRETELVRENEMGIDRQTCRQTYRQNRKRVREREKQRSTMERVQRREREKRTDRAELLDTQIETACIANKKKFSQMPTNAEANIKKGVLAGS